jgi:hypothetical protein
MISWLAMCALGGAVESMITILTPRFIPFFLLLWIIGAFSRPVSPKLASLMYACPIAAVNVSVCVFSPVLLPGIYRSGYATPFYNVQQAVRSVVFGTRNQCAFSVYAPADSSARI